MNNLTPKIYSMIENLLDIVRQFYPVCLIVILITAAGVSNAQTGSITGSIVDGETGEGLIGANILLDGTTIGAASDIEGNYRIDNVPVGTYTLIASMIGYTKVSVTGVEVKANEQIRLDITLNSEAFETEEVVVTARMILDNDAALLKNRQKSVSVSDAIGLDLIKKSGSDDAGDALKKVVGTSVVDGKYVYVRGLGDRYSSTQLNGAELPSSDPDKKSFQLDLIPTNLLQNIVTIKTFTPDKPGNFSGGIVDIGTQTFPDKFTLKLSTGTSYNSQANGNSDFLTYQGGNNDWIGIDDGTREIPGEFSNPDLKIPNPVLARNNLDLAKELDQFSKSFNTGLSTRKSTPPVNSSFSLSVGDQISTGEVSNFGFLGSFTFKRDYSFYNDGRVERYTLSDVNANELNPQLLLNDSQGTSETTWGGLVTAAYNFNPEQQLSGNIFYSKSGISKSRFMTGKWPQEIGFDPQYNNLALRWIERDIRTYQLRGRHHLSGLLNSTIEWSSSFANTTQDEPDFRLATYIVTQTPQGASYTIDGSNFDSPSRYFRYLEDKTNTYNLDITLPFAQWDALKSSFKFGGMYQQLDRDFSERIFTYNASDEIFNQVGGNVDLLFQNSNNGLIDSTQTGGRTRYVFGNTIFDRSFDKNNYTGDQNIVAGYGMINLPIFRELRFIGGARYETTEINVVSQDVNIEEGKIDEADILPSVNFIYQLSEDMNLRLAGTETLARPTFREIAPYSTKQFVNDEELVGNPDLDRTKIQNYDLRWEWFLRPGEIIATSIFYKVLENPIERSFASGSSASNKIVTYTNVDEAEIFGAELEMRLGLDYVTDILSDFSFGFNISLVNSTIDIPQSELENRLAIDSSSSETRELQGQSPYMINIDLTYANDDLGIITGLYFNTFGERLATVSANLTPDVFEQPDNILNFTLSKTLLDDFNISLAIKNILNAENKHVYRYKGNDFLYQSYKPGRKYSIGISYRI